MTQDHIDPHNRVAHLEHVEDDGTVTIANSFIPPSPEEMVDDLYGPEIAALAAVDLPVAMLRFPDIEAWALVHPPHPPQPGKAFLLITDEDGTLALDRDTADVDGWLVGLYRDPEDASENVHEIDNTGPAALASFALARWNDLQEELTDPRP